MTLEELSVAMQRICLKDVDCVFVNHLSELDVFTTVRLLMGRTRPVDIHDMDFYRAMAAYKRRGIVHALRVRYLADKMMTACVKALWWLDRVLGLGDVDHDDIPEYHRPIEDVNALERYMKGLCTRTLDL
jgi:hypothetical protein